jgi:hypothetical protein
MVEVAGVECDLRFPNSAPVFLLLLLMSCLRDYVSASKCHWLNLSEVIFATFLQIHFGWRVLVSPPMGSSAGRTMSSLLAKWLLGLMPLFPLVSEWLPSIPRRHAP